jgi:hypothetical protein
MTSGTAIAAAKRFIDLLLLMDSTPACDKPPAPMRASHEETGARCAQM